MSLSSNVLAAPPLTAALSTTASAAPDTASKSDPAPLRTFVAGLAELLERYPQASLNEADILREGGSLLATLVARDDWLPAAFAEPHPDFYQQFLLYADARERFSIVSFVWGPGQATPIHDHTVWGLIGMLRGAEYAQGYRIAPDGRLVADGPEIDLLPGAVEAVSPSIGDVHRVRNAYSDKVSISIHVYGANIGGVQRSVFAEDGTRKPFVSGYTNKVLPNIWDRSAEIRAQWQDQLATAAQ